MKILHIDDNDDIIKFVEMTVTSMGHDFSSADGGRKGLEMIIENQYDLVFLDLSMPEFSGIDVVNALEEKDMIGKQIIILFSASSGNDNQIEGLLKKGIHSYLEKPVDIDQLMEKITAIESEI